LLVIPAPNFFYAAMRVVTGIVSVLGLWIAPAMAQRQNNQVEHMDKMPLYRVNVVARTTTLSETRTNYR
jgi:hypothetical protein